MAIFKCKMCGADLEIVEDSKVCECEYCGSTQTIPSLDNEKKINLFTRANRLRMACEFDKAAGVYESIVSEFQDEAEAYWGIILCKYGIEYVDDPKTGKKIPTCHRSSFDSVMEDSNFEMVMECGDIQSRLVYREEAKTIEKLRIDIIEVSSKEEPYDIFICYKETDENGDRTIDSVIAQDVYDALTEKGYKVFFSRITLEDKLGQEYEPYIFAALNSAKVMLAFGTDYEYYNAVWVKNEWSRFLSLIEKGEKKTLIPCYKDIDAYDMPNEFKRLQAQDMGKVGAIQDLIRGIEKIIAPKLPVNDSVSQEQIQAAIVSAMNNVNTLTSNVSQLLVRGNMALEDGEWEKADGFFEDVLNQDAKCAEAYLGKWLAELKYASLQNVEEVIKNFDLNDNLDIKTDSKLFKRILQFAEPPLTIEIQKILDAIKTYENKKENKKREDKEKRKEEEKIRIFNEMCLVDNDKILSCRAKSITEIIIPFGIKVIGQAAFSMCESLNNVVIPESVTSIEKKAFMGCKSLKSVEIPETVSDIGENIFDGCEQLENVKISERMNDNEHFKTYVFNIIEQNKILVEQNKISSFSSICDVEDGTIMRCIDKEIDEIEIPNGIVKIAEDAFVGCDSLKKVTISQGITSISEYAFYGCESLIEIVLPESLISIGESAFAGCKSLTAINIPRNVSDIGANAFPHRCLVEIDINNNMYKSLDGMITSKDGKSLISYCTDNEYEEICIPRNITHISSLAFKDCENVKRIIIPDSIEDIGINAFSHNCSIEIDDNNSYYKSKNGMILSKDGKKLIAYCTNGEEKEIKIPIGVTDIETNAFSECESITTIILPECVNNIKKEAFRECKSLTTINIPEGCTNIGERAFYGCESLKELMLSKCIKNIGKGAFSGCKSITSIAIPQGVTNIEAYTFLECESLVNVALSEGVTSIDDCAFWECKLLTAMVIPKSVTHIGNNVFSGCKSLSMIVIPEEVTDIGSGVFNDCNALSQIYISEHLEQKIKNLLSNVCKPSIIYYEKERDKIKRIEMEKESLLNEKLRLTKEIEMYVGFFNKGKKEKAIQQLQIVESKILELEEKLEESSQYLWQG